MAEENVTAPRRKFNWFSSRKTEAKKEESSANDSDGMPTRSKWAMGILNDKETIEVPGSVLLLAQGRNEPLGLRNAPARTSHSSIPTGMPHDIPPPTPRPQEDEKKKTKDGQIILDPQPDHSPNDPLNWAAWRRDLALLSLGLYCMIGGGITPLIAAGFTNVAHDYGVKVEEVALTTGLYMMGLGIGSVIFSPTAILYGKRPVYLFSAIIFIISSVWCALSPNFVSLLIARIFQGIAVSPVECLPSATIAEIFFLHERAFRIGIYTLLLLGGKNLIPLVSAAIIQHLSWRWVFWIVAMVTAFSGALLYLFVPETFWDRTPIPKDRTHPKRPSLLARLSHHHHKEPPATPAPHVDGVDEKHIDEETTDRPTSQHSRHKDLHVGFASMGPDSETVSKQETDTKVETPRGGFSSEDFISSVVTPRSSAGAGGLSPPTPELRNFNSPFYKTVAPDYFTPEARPPSRHDHLPQAENGEAGPNTHKEAGHDMHGTPATIGQKYTHNLRHAPPLSFGQQLRVWNGRLNHDKWWKACMRPLILFSYPAVLWSAVVYSCSVGWLIVISESVAIIYREGIYHFGALSTGLVYISPFIGGVLGTAVAGRISDVIVKAMARRNGGLYEPEFRLVMAIPIALTTTIGLMGFGWSASEEDPWIVPTVFFGIVSFGCALGSTTSITFCVDSYRQYAGEALVTLNFSKNIFHGLVFSLFVTDWLTADGAKTVFLWIGIIQLIVLLFTIPMYIYGKRARMWTVRMNFMEKY